MYIQENLYREVIKYIPILCVDIVVRNEDGNVLLIRRRNEPLKDVYWVIGGRVYLGEKSRDAAERTLRSEVGLNTTAGNIIGIYEGFFRSNVFDDVQMYHTVSVVFETEIEKSTKIELDEQSSSWKWCSNLPESFIVESII